VVRGKKQLSKQELKVYNDVADALRHHLECSKRGLKWNDLRLVERYIKMETHFLLKFKLEDSEEFIACFQRDWLWKGGQRTVKIREDCIWPVAPAKPLCEFGSFGWHHAARAKRRAGGEQQAVFVYVVKSMEPPEGVIPSFVWFDRVNEVHSFLPHTLYFSCLEFGRQIFVGSPRYREGCSRGDGISGGNDKPASEMVERTPEILQGVADYQRDVGRNIFNPVEIIRALSRVWLVLKADRIWHGVEESVEGELQILDVLFGPFDFPEYIKTSRGHEWNDTTIG